LKKIILLTLSLVFVSGAVLFIKPNSVNETGTMGCKNGYGDQETSRYILPYETGSSFVVGQGNCTDGSHSNSQSYAYDFDMPVGTKLIASRDGEAIRVIDLYEENNNTSGQENYIIIKHDDGTISGYYHITKNGSQVEVGDKIEQGELIALSGNTGDSTEPHLHFEIAECEDCETLAITFANTSAHSNGLFEGKSYKAE